MKNSSLLNGKLSELAERHRSNAVLPGFAYSDEALFDLEVERLFRREWISVTCAPSVPEPGDVFPLMIAGHSLLVARYQGYRSFRHLGDRDACFRCCCHKYRCLRNCLKE